MEGMKRFVEISEELNKQFNKRVIYRTMTNCTLISEEFMTLVKHYNFNVGISIDGPKEMTDKVRIDELGHGVFDRIMDGVKMKLKYTFEVMELDGQSVAVPVGAGSDELHAILNMNEEAAAILKLMKDDTNEEKIAEALIAEYDITKEAILPLIHSFVEKLRLEGLICE